jgi:hypothetical protein
MRLHQNESSPLFDTKTRVLGKAANWRTSSIAIEKELVLCDCETAWTQAANVTATADATYFREGLKSAKMAFAAGFTTGIAAYGDSASDALNLATAGYTHIAYEVRSSTVRAAGAFTLGLDNAANFATAEGAGKASQAMPAIPVADTWYTVCQALSAAQLALTSVDSVGVTAVTDPGTSDLYIDNIRLLKIVTAGDQVITIPEIHSAGNTNGADNWVDLFIFPFESKALSSNPAPVTMRFIPYRATTAGSWAATDAAQGSPPRHAVGDYFDGEPRAYTAMAIRRSDVLTSPSVIEIEVME